MLLLADLGNGFFSIKSRDSAIDQVLNAPCRASQKVNRLYAITLLRLDWIDVQEIHPSP
ncbi:hypothetical protein [Lyngbya aestuarii]|uniref:hypothetical protein n=1 Tax=Lyngbya aestuarii TaxID=118322 RepID=UPI00403DD0A9